LVGRRRRRFRVPRRRRRRKELAQERRQEACGDAGACGRLRWCLSGSSSPAWQGGACGAAGEEERGDHQGRGCRSEKCTTTFFGSCAPLRRSGQCFSGWRRGAATCVRVLCLCVFCVCGGGAGEEEGVEREENGGGWLVTFRPRLQNSSARPFARFTSSSHRPRPHQRHQTPRDAFRAARRELKHEFFPLPPATRASIMAGAPGPMGKLQGAS